MFNCFAPVFLYAEFMRAPAHRPMRVAPAWSPSCPHSIRIIAVPSPYQPPTCAAASSDFPGKIRGCSGAGRGLVRRWYGDDPYGVGTGGAPSGGYAHGAMGGGAHEFGVEENRRKTIKQPGTGWAWYTCMEAMGGEIFAKTAKTPPLQSGVCGEVVTRHSSARHLRPRGHQREQREGG